MAHQHGNATRREQERHMVKARIYAGITAIVLFGVMSMLYVYRGLADVVGHLTRLEQVDAPFSIAALEMEKMLANMPSAYCSTSHSRCRMCAQKPLTTAQTFPSTTRTTCS